MFLHKISGCSSTNGTIPHRLLFNEGSSSGVGGLVFFWGLLRCAFLGGGARIRVRWNPPQAQKGDKIPPTLLLRNERGVRHYPILPHSYAETNLRCCTKVRGCLASAIYRLVELEKAEEELARSQVRPRAVCFNCHLFLIENLGSKHLCFFVQCKKPWVVNLSWPPLVDAQMASMQCRHVFRLTLTVG